MFGSTDGGGVIRAASSSTAAENLGQGGAPFAKPEGRRQAVERAQIHGIPARRAFARRKRSHAASRRVTGTVMLNLL